MVCVRGRPCYFPNMYAVPQGHSGPIDRPLLKSPCVAVVRLPEVTPAMEFFFIFFISLYDLPANKLLQIAIFSLGRRRQTI